MIRCNNDYLAFELDLIIILAELDIDSSLVQVSEDD